MSCFPLTVEDKETRCMDRSWCPIVLFFVLIAQAYTEQIPTLTGRLYKSFSLNRFTFPVLAPPACHPLIAPSCLGIIFHPQPSNNTQLNFGMQSYRDQTYFWVHWGREKSRMWLTSREVVLHFLWCWRMWLFGTAIFIRYFLKFYLWVLESANPRVHFYTFNILFLS